MYRLILRTPVFGQVYSVRVYASVAGAQRAARRQDLVYGAHLTRELICVKTGERELCT